MATVQVVDDQYSVSEGDGSVEVCVELTSVPAGGLECEIEVTLVFNEGTKTRKYTILDNMIYKLPDLLIP